MSLYVNTNISAMNTVLNLTNNNNALNKSLERLSSGYRINQASDDPAGLIISEELRGQLSGIQAAQQVVGNSINYFNVADSAMSQVNSMLVTMQGLATQAVNGATTADQRSALNFQFQNASASITRIFSQSNFAGATIFTNGASMSFQVGEQAGNTVNFLFRNATAGGTISFNGTQINFGTATSGFQGLLAGNLSTVTGASLAMSQVQPSIQALSTYRGAIGAFTTNIFQSQQQYLGIYLQNLTASEATIRDTNMAQETTRYTQNQVLVQAATAVLAQANTTSQNVLQLLK